MTAQVTSLLFGQNILGDTLYSYSINHHNATVKFRHTLASGHTKYTAPIIPGARGVMVIITGYGHDDTSSNPGPDWLHFT